MQQMGQLKLHLLRPSTASNKYIRRGDGKASRGQIRFLCLLPASPASALRMDIGQLKIQHVLLVLLI